MPKAKLYDSFIRQIGSVDREIVFNDTEALGLVLRGGPNATPAFMIDECAERGTKLKKHSLGLINEIGPGEARRRAKARTYIHNPDQCVAWPLLQSVS